jgi:N-acetylmuramoyl-L-alanine amidase
MNHKLLYTSIFLTLYSNDIICWSFFAAGEKVDTIQKPSISAHMYAQESHQDKRITIVLDPAGDAHNVGRIIDDAFERSLTYLCIQSLKQLLEKNNSILRVLITKSAGQAIESFYNANFANQLNTDIYITISCYQLHEKYNTIDIYYVLYNPITDFWHKKSSQLGFIPFDQAYLNNLTKTAHYAKIISDTLKAAGRTHNFLCSSPCGIPYKPLGGIMAPAIALELGISTKDSWSQLVPSIEQALTAIVAKIDTEKNLYDKINTPVY